MGADEKLKVVNMDAHYLVDESGNYHLQDIQSG